MKRLGIINAFKEYQEIRSDSRDIIEDSVLRFKESCSSCGVISICPMKPSE
jgi:hypothetical protein